jgi:hypothetical protein
LILPPTTPVYQLQAHRPLPISPPHRRYIEACRIALPELPAAQFTKLDFNLLEMRREKRHQAEDAAKYLLSHPPDDLDDALEAGPHANRGGLLEQGVEVRTPS